jgi:HSP20 family protein
MPGFTKESIRITGTDNTLHLSGDNETRHIDTDIPLNAKVEPKSAKATYKNGVLDITLKLLEAPKGEGVDIKVN